MTKNIFGLWTPEGWDDARYHVDQRVTSYGQTGGVTAHTVNMHPPARNLDDPAAADLKRLILEGVGGGSVYIGASANDHEAHQFAGQIAKFLEANGLQIREMASVLSAPPLAPGVGVSPGRVMVGPIPK